MYPTIEDIYDAWIDADRGQKEKIRIFDLKGLVKCFFKGALDISYHFSFWWLSSCYNFCSFQISRSNVIVQFQLS